VTSTMSSVAATSGPTAATTTVAAPSPKSSPFASPPNPAHPGQANSSGDARPFTVKGIPQGCHDSVKIATKIHLTDEIRRVQAEKATELNICHCDESYISRLLQIADFCARAIINHPRAVMMDAVHDIKRFDEPNKSNLRHKIIQSLIDGPYMTPLKNATDTVQDKTGATPDIANLPMKIKETIGNHATILNNMIEESGFFEDAFSIERIKNLFNFHIQPQVKLLIKILFQQEMDVPVDQNHFLLQPSTDSNAHDISVIKEDILLLKNERCERQVTEEKLIHAIADLKNDAIAVEFEREEKKIRVDAGDRDLWNKSN
jgi:hypothetical protein